MNIVNEYMGSQWALFMPTLMLARIYKGVLVFKLVNLIIKELLHRLWFIIRLGRTLVDVPKAHLHFLMRTRQ